MEKIENGEVATLICQRYVPSWTRLSARGAFIRTFFFLKRACGLSYQQQRGQRKQQENDFTPFLNIINEWYAKDTSKKIRAVMKSKGKQANIFAPIRLTAT